METLFALPQKDKGIVRYLVGGTLFGLGWALAGACPGPMFILAGAGYIPILVVIASAIAGTYVYGLLRNKTAALTAAAISSNHGFELGNLKLVRDRHI